MFTEEVISITPDNKIITFANLNKAKATLLKQYHSTIIANEVELLQRLGIDGLIDWWKRFNIPIREFSKYEKTYYMPMGFRLSDQHAANYMWPIFIMQGRKTVEKLKSGWGSSKPTKKNGTRHYIRSTYAPGKDPVRDALYVKQTPQCRTLIDLAVEFCSEEGGIPDYRFYTLLEKNKVKFRTKQSTERIFNYYRARLIELGFIDTKPV